MRAFITSQIVTAEAMKAGRDGAAGFQVVNPDGFSHWVSEADFWRNHREISPHERTLLEQTDAEHQVSSISDGNQPAEVKMVCDRFVAGSYVPDQDEVACAICGHLEDKHRAQPKSSSDLGDAAYCEIWVAGEFDEAINQHRCQNCGGRRLRHP